MSPPGLETLLERWGEARERGQDIPLVELCRDRPDLAGELAERIAGLRQIDALVRSLGPCVGTLPDPTSTLAPSPQAAVEPPRVPGHEVLHELGRGSSAVVYLARETSTGRLVAIKVLSGRQHSGSPALERFHAEARIVARVAHPGVVSVFGVGEAVRPDGPRAYLSMEYCPGGSLVERLGGRPLPIREAARLVESLARTLDAVHAAGVLHLDLKPGNVLLARRLRCQLGSGEGRQRPWQITPKICDFGVARGLDDTDAPAGLVLGTPSYMPPEQALGQTSQVGPAADIWSLGAILYECLTGRPPFLGETALETLYRVTHEELLPPRQRNPECPAALEAIVLRCLTKDPGGRPATAAELAGELAEWRRAAGTAARITKGCPAGPQDRPCPTPPRPNPPRTLAPRS